jgi:very-short-patch-repair endonuclease
VSGGFLIETAIAERAPTLTLPRKRERERIAFGVNTVFPTRRGEPPLPLLSAEARLRAKADAGEDWGGGSAASEVAMDERPKWKVSSKLRSNARSLRKNSTDVERILWSELRDHRLNGAGCRRQVPIGNYIADFVCHAAKLVIELDGGQHFSDGQEAVDAKRSAIIETRGFQVLRFSNHDVMTNRAGVLETIAAAIGERAPTLALPRIRLRPKAGFGGQERERGQEKPAGKPTP